jgi:hypothetical protein
LVIGGFGNIIIGPSLECCEAGCVIFISRKHNYWDCRSFRVAPQAAQNLGPCHVGQNQIQQNKIGLGRPRHGKATFAIDRQNRGVASRAKFDLENDAIGRNIIYNQNFARHFFNTY